MPGNIRLARPICHTPSRGWPDNFTAGLSTFAIILNSQRATSFVRLSTSLWEMLRPGIRPPQSRRIWPSYFQPMLRNPEPDECFHSTRKSLGHYITNHPRCDLFGSSKTRRQRLAVLYLCPC